MAITLNSFQRHFSTGGSGEVRTLPLYLEKERLPRSPPGSAVPTRSALPSPWGAQRKRGLWRWDNGVFVSLAANITIKRTETPTATQRFLRDKKCMLKKNIHVKKTCMVNTGRAFVSSMTPGWQVRLYSTDPWAVAGHIRDAPAWLQFSILIRAS